MPERCSRMVSRSFVFLVPEANTEPLSWFVRLVDFGEGGRIMFGSMYAEAVSATDDPMPAGFTGDVLVFEGYGDQDPSIDAAVGLPTQYVFSYTEAWQQAEGEAWAPSLKQVALGTTGGACYGVKRAGDLVLRVTCSVTAAPGVDVRLHLTLKAEVF